VTSFIAFNYIKLPDCLGDLYHAFALNSTNAPTKRYEILCLEVRMRGKLCETVYHYLKLTSIKQHFISFEAVAQPIRWNVYIGVRGAFARHFIYILSEKLAYDRERRSKVCREFASISASNDFYTAPIMFIDNDKPNH